MSQTLIPARPEPLSLDPARTAVLVVDMQNAFSSCVGRLGGPPRAPLYAVTREEVV